MTTTTLRLAVRFHAPPERLFEVLFGDVRDIMRYTQAPAKVDAKAGGVYSIFDGAISGVFEEVGVAKTILTWRMRNWAPDMTSRVTLTITGKGVCGRNVLLDADVQRGVGCGYTALCRAARAAWRLLRLRRVVPARASIASCALTSCCFDQAVSQRRTMPHAACRLILFSSPPLHCSRRCPLRAGDNTSLVSLEQTGVPYDDAHGNSHQDKQVLQGWRERVFGGIARFVGIAMDKDSDD